MIRLSQATFDVTLLRAQVGLTLIGLSKMIDFSK